MPHSPSEPRTYPRVAATGKVDYEPIGFATAMDKRLDLKDVTLVSADSAFVGWTARSFARCQALCDFAETILFTHAPVVGPFRTVIIPQLNSIEDYSRFCLLEMGRHIETPYCLLVQWDSFVVDPSMWTRAYRRYDYIGAAWRGDMEERLRVGNGGFSWRSRKLLKALVELRPAGSYFYEDRVISHLYRDVLERKYGVRFAPVDLADRFSYEFHEPTAPTFGFHGLQHMWRHLDQTEMMELVAAIDLKKMSSEKLLQLTTNALKGGRRAVAAAVYRKLRAQYPAARVRVALTGWFKDERSAADVLATLEQLLG